LFLCTGNSARSIMAEALANHLAIGGGKLRAYSAGSHPKAAPHPLALETLASHGIATEGLHSKSWDVFAGDNAPALDFVFTVCDSAAGEQCPYWPGQPVTAHWGVEDPPAAGDEAAQRKAFREAFFTLKRRIELFTALPFDKLDRMKLAEQARAIGGEGLPSSTA
jgi:protein-tyrosine-phosphatase